MDSEWYVRKGWLDTHSFLLAQARHYDRVLRSGAHGLRDKRAANKGYKSVMFTLNLLQNDYDRRYPPKGDNYVF